MEYLLSVGLSFEVCQSALNCLRAIEPKIFEGSLQDRAERWFMLYQGAGDEGLRCTEFDERKAIAAIQDGRAIIPIQIEALGKRLEKRLQLVGGLS